MPVMIAKMEAQSSALITRLRSVILPVPLWVRYEAVTQNPALGEFRIEHKLRSYLTITGTAQSEKERYGLGLGIKKDF